MTAGPGSKYNATGGGEAYGPMAAGGRSSSNRLDGPPPLPREAKKKAPNWMVQDAEASMGGDLANPMVQVIQNSSEVESGIQKQAALLPDQGQAFAMILAAFRQATAQGLAGTAQPGVGPPGGMMAPQMPMPPMQGPPGAGM